MGRARTGRGEEGGKGGGGGGRGGGAKGKERLDRLQDKQKRREMAPAHIWRADEQRKVPSPSWWDPHHPHCIGSSTAPPFPAPLRALDLVLSSCSFPRTLKFNPSCSLLFGTPPCPLPSLPSSASCLAPPPAAAPSCCEASFTGRQETERRATPRKPAYDKQQ
jgi:hypothetical protein